MRLISSLACAVVGLALQACALPAHNNTLVFAVNRDIGVGVASGPTDAGVNIHGHLFLGRWGDRAMFAFVVDRPDLAKPILERKG